MKEMEFTQEMDQEVDLVDLESSEQEEVETNGPTTGDKAVLVLAVVGGVAAANFVCRCGKKLYRGVKAKMADIAAKKDEKKSEKSLPDEEES